MTKPMYSDLPAGWLEQDMKRAAEQVAKWKIVKFEQGQTCPCHEPRKVK